MEKLLKGSVHSFEKDFEIETYGGEKLQIRQGDKFRVECKVPKGVRVTAISGGARNCWMIIEDVEYDERLDSDEISNTIMKILNTYNIKNYIEEDELEAIKDDINEYLGNF